MGIFCNLTLCNTEIWGVGMFSSIHTIPLLSAINTCSSSYQKLFDEDSHGHWLFSIQSFLRRDQRRADRTRLRAKIEARNWAVCYCQCIRRAEGETRISTVFQSRCAKSKTWRSFPRVYLLKSLKVLSRRRRPIVTFFIFSHLFYFFHFFSQFFIVFIFVIVVVVVAVVIVVVVASK